MKYFPPLSNLWLSGMVLGMCVGNLAAGGVTLPQVWFVAALMNAGAILVVAVSLRLWLVQAGKAALTTQQPERRG